MTREIFCRMGPPKARVVKEPDRLNNKFDLLGYNCTVQFSVYEKETPDEGYKEVFATVKGDLKEIKYFDPEIGEDNEIEEIKDRPPEKLR